MDISEQEHHYEVLLALKNLADVRRNSAPYSLPIIPCPLPSEIVDGEHFVTTDLLNLIAGRASPSRDLEAETSSRELVSRTPSVPSASTSGGSGSAQLAPSRGDRGSHLEHLPLLRKGNSSAPGALKIKRRGTIKQLNTPETQVKDFVPWVHPEVSRPSDLEEGEEKEEMTRLLNHYAAKIWKRQESFERGPNQTEGSSWPAMDGDSEMQAIVIPSSPEIGSSDRPDRRMFLWGSQGKPLRLCPHFR